MIKRGRFLYQDGHGTVFIKFEHPGSGVPIEALLPEAGRGAGFAKFPIADYFNLSELVLAAPGEWRAVCQAVSVKGADPENPATVQPPSLNLDYLRLRRGDGMDAARTAELFTIVSAYWQNAANLALEPGLVARCWHCGMKPTAILGYIRDFTDENGKLVLPGGRGAEVMHIVYEVFKDARGLVDDDLTQDQVSDMVAIWLRATRAVPLDSLEARNPALHWSDYRRLRLVDASGKALPDNIRKLAKRVFAADPAPSFAELAAWADQQAGTKANGQTKSAQAQLKKKRKQGRINRKRGR